MKKIACPPGGADVSRLSLYVPESTATPSPLGTVLVCPGGGYSRTADHEAEPVAAWAVGCGFAAAVLRYHVEQEGPGSARHPAPLNDALQAMRTLRRHATELGLNGRIAVLGFSAGGHLAASLSVHGVADAETRPDASVRIYPVITMVGPEGHAGSRDNLLGADAPHAHRQHMSPECQVTSQTPPAFLVHGVDDRVVPVENSLMYVAALRRAGVSFELHCYPEGEHGFGLGEGQWRGKPIGEWPRLAGVWLRGVFRGVFGGGGGGG